MTKYLLSGIHGQLRKALNAIFILLSFRECAVKFNDYFEFPRDIDMEPFTELGLAKLQGKSLV